MYALIISEFNLINLKQSNPKRLLVNFKSNTNQFECETSQFMELQKLDVFNEVFELQKVRDNQFTLRSDFLVKFYPQSNDEYLQIQVYEELDQFPYKKLNLKKDMDVKEVCLESFKTILKCRVSMGEIRESIGYRMPVMFDSQCYGYFDVNQKKKLDFLEEIKKSILTMKEYSYYHYTIKPPIVIEDFLYNNPKRIKRLQPQIVNDKSNDAIFKSYSDQLLNDMLRQIYLNLGQGQSLSNIKIYKGIDPSDPVTSLREKYKATPQQISTCLLKELLAHAENGFIDKKHIKEGRYELYKNYLNVDGLFKKAKQDFANLFKNQQKNIDSMKVDELFKELHIFALNNNGLVQKIYRDFEAMIPPDIRQEVKEILLMLAWQRNQNYFPNIIVNKSLVKLVIRLYQLYEKKSCGQIWFMVNGLLPLLPQRSKSSQQNQLGYEFIDEYYLHALTRLPLLALPSQKMMKLFELGMSFEFLLGDQIASLFCDNIHFLRLMDMFVYYIYDSQLTNKKTVYLIVIAVGLAIVDLLDFKNAETISELQFLLKTKIWNLEELQSKMNFYYQKSCKLMEDEKYLESKEYTSYFVQVSKQLGSISDFIYSSRNGINNENINQIIGNFKRSQKPKKINSIDIYIHSLEIFSGWMDEYEVKIIYGEHEEDVHAKSHYSFVHSENQFVIELRVQVKEELEMKLELNLLELELNVIYKLTRPFQLLKNKPKQYKQLFSEVSKAELSIVVGGEESITRFVESDAYFTRHLGQHYQYQPQEINDYQLLLKDKDKINPQYKYKEANKSLKFLIPNDKYQQILSGFQSQSKHALQLFQIEFESKNFQSSISDFLIMLAIFTNDSVRVKCSTLYNLVSALKGQVCLKDVVWVISQIYTFCRMIPPQPQALLYMVRPQLETRILKGKCGDQDVTQELQSAHLQMSIKGISDITFANIEGKISITKDMDLQYPITLQIYQGGVIYNKVITKPEFKSKIHSLSSLLHHNEQNITLGLDKAIKISQQEFTDILMELPLFTLLANGFNQHKIVEIKNLNQSEIENIQQQIKTEVAFPFQTYNSKQWKLGNIKSLVQGRKQQGQEFKWFLIESQDKEKYLVRKDEIISFSNINSQNIELLKKSDL